MKQSIVIDDVEKPPSQWHAFSIRWAVEDGKPPMPVLYVNGRRCVNPWTACLDITSEGGGDVSG